jgi:cephalosporin hydroxylase
MLPFPWKKILRKTLLENKVSSSLITRMFHLLWYNSSNTWLKNTYLGYPIQQCPFDLQLYQEQIFKLRPNFILQTGVNYGGSVLFFATMLDLIDSPRNAVVVGIDISISDKAKTLNHPRIKLFEGDSTDLQLVKQVTNILPCNTGFVSLDSDHTKKHVSKEINIYKEFVELGSYLVVEDTHINGHPVFSSFGPGPYEAAQEFLRENNRFIRDDELWSRNKMSFHKYGWLKRIK